MKTDSNRTVIAIDLAKRVFQVHWVEPRTKKIGRLKTDRDGVLRFLAKRPPSIVAFEASGPMHYWGRTFENLGHDVRAIAPKFVRPFVKTNKSDAADAHAIWEAVQRPEMRFVPIKTPEQQGVLGLHRLRESRVRSRVRLVNQLHGLLGEFGVVTPLAWRAMMSEILDVLELAECPVPKILRGELRKQLQQVQQLTQQIASLDADIKAWHQRDVGSQRIGAIPGVGVLTATAVVATVGDMHAFRSGREFAAFVGLVPRHWESGGEVRMQGIGRRGDQYLRRLLINAARTSLRVQMRKGKLDPWVKALLERRHRHVVAVALANKFARVIWALLTRGDDYREAYVPVTRPKRRASEARRGTAAKA